MTPPVPPCPGPSSYLNERNQAFLNTCELTDTDRQRRYKMPPLEISYCSFSEVSGMEVTQLGQGSPLDSSWLSGSTKGNSRVWEHALVLF